ncbi:MAG: hypothetical protein II453_19350 [Alphaproteobacteria bacterium]|nr:hypothetical protein [Alphaproteobacteria bacterium]
MIIPEIVERSLEILEIQLEQQRNLRIKSDMNFKSDILRICEALFLLIDENASATEIADLAYSTYKQATNCSERVQKFLGDLSVNKYSEFAINNSEIVNRIINILVMELTKIN